MKITKGIGTGRVPQNTLYDLIELVALLQKFSLAVMEQVLGFQAFLIVYTNLSFCAKH